MTDLSQMSLEIAKTLGENGLPSGVPLMVHSGMRPIMNELRRQGHSGPNLAERTCAAFAEALHHLTGPEGSIVIPGYFYDYARKGACFDVRTSPPDRALGAFPDYFFRNIPHHRSLSPLVSLMCSGAQGHWLSTPGSTHGNGVCSPWARMVETDGWVLCFGCSSGSMTFVHHVEHLVGVPHLYNKLYRVPIIDAEGQSHPWSLCSVRFLDPRFPVTYDLAPLMDELAALGTLRVGQWGDVPYCFAPLRGVQEFLIDRLGIAPYGLLAHPPTFVPGVIPNDGPMVD